MKLCIVVEETDAYGEISASLFKVEGWLLEDRFGQDVVQSRIHVSVVMGIWFPHHEENIRMKEYLSQWIQVF